MAAPGAPVEGLLLDRYELLERLGVGASATVWRARDIERDRVVALKLLHPHLFDDPAARARLHVEAAAVRRLDHPAIARLLAHHLDGDQPALAFEHVEGVPLDQHIADHAPLAPTDAARIAATIAEALAHAHAQGVVHRDVKPANVILDNGGGVHLLDFGVAGQAGVLGLTEVGTTVGTLPYMAPEQLAGLPPIPATDVYALGVVLYEMLAGRRPHEAPTAVAMAEEQLVPPVRLDGATSATGDVALSAMSLETAERPAAAVLSAVLARLAEPAGDATQAMAAVAPMTVAMPAGSASRAVPRRRLIRALAVVVLAIAVTAVIALAGLPGVTPPTATIEPAAVQAPSPSATPEPPVAVAPADDDTDEQAGNSGRGGGDDDDDDDDDKRGKKGKSKPPRKGKPGDD
jgi:serine/threonine-protein kinase